jgi:hypothetical protein
VRCVALVPPLPRLPTVTLTARAPSLWHAGAPRRFEEAQRVAATEDGAMRAAAEWERPLSVRPAANDLVTGVDTVALGVAVALLTQRALVVDWVRASPLSWFIMLHSN